MSIRMYVITISLLGLGIFLSCTHHNNHNLHITVQESEKTYKFSASFPEFKTAKVHRVINNSISPNGLFASVNDYLNVTTTLQDKTAFAVKASPGIIQVTVDREGNSPASYNRIKAMCEEVKKSLKE